MLPSRLAIWDGDAVSCPSSDAYHLLEFRVVKGLDRLIWVVNKRSHNIQIEEYLIRFNQPLKGYLSKETVRVRDDALFRDPFLKVWVE